MPQNIKCSNDNKCKLLSKSEYKKDAGYITPVFSAMLVELKKMDKPRFTQRMVGSAKRNMVYEYGDSEYDIDYQLDIRISKKYKKLPNDLKLSYDNALSTVFKNKENKLVYPHKYITFTSKISTSVITVNREEIKDGKIIKSSYDLALIDVSNNKICRGKKSDSTNQEENFRWEILPNVCEAYAWFKSASADEVDAIKAKYIDRKCENRKISKESTNYRSSTELLIESINNYRNENV